ncbi:uncharacterized protein LOC126822441 isoform X1 [Patella vulgata]|uniref:uncharacterized protein LOC126822441 isoform X1 n=1 Tax=Patella vulgata TaxID=6465 RepID=UPI0024A80134|nr:uncharacterized protein LOC126822441 isoform X1 [Patella vulgata]
MHLTSTGAPSRQLPSKNVTGIYLGLEGNSNPPKQRSGIPPLARGRAGLSYRVRTPVEERRYEPASYTEKKQMVELFRIKEDKRGFVGQPIIKKQHSNGEKRPCTTSPNASPRRWGPAKKANLSKFSDRIRTNPRHFTPIINSGVTRSENLTGFASYATGMDFSRNPQVDNIIDITRLHLIDNVTDDLNKLGVVQPIDSFSSSDDTYRRLYQGDVDLAYNLLPSARQNTPPISRENTSYSTGFSVRSYRNPNQAEIFSDFPDPKGHLRPKTVPANRAFVPQPYFFRYYNHHRPVRTISAKSKYSLPVTEDKDSVYGGSKIVGVPGAGRISTSLKQRQTARQKHNSSPVELDPPNTFHKSDESEANISMPVSTTSVHNTYPSTELKDIARQTEKNQGSLQKVDDKSASNFSSDKSMATTETHRDSSILLHPEETRKMRPLKTSNSGADITLGLEDVDGATAEVEIDVNDNESEIAPEDIPRGKVRKASIVEKLSKTKASEAYVATVKESAEQRQKDFEKLLNEHAEIVQEIGRTASAENLNSDERDP